MNVVFGAADGVGEDSVVFADAGDVRPESRLEILRDESLAGTCVAPTALGRYISWTQPLRTGLSSFAPTALQESAIAQCVRDTRAG